MKLDIVVFGFGLLAGVMLGYVATDNWDKSMPFAQDMYDAGFEDGANEAALDVEPILTEEQYNKIPRRTLFRMKDLTVLK